MRIWKFIRNSLVIVAILLGFIFLLANAFFYLSPQGLEGNRNRANSQQIKPGMSMQEVVTIMGQPSHQGPNGKGGTLVYSYTPPPGASSAVTIFFHADSTVRHVENMD